MEGSKRENMEDSPTRRANYTVEIIVAAGYLLLFCLGGAACLFSFSLIVGKQAPSRINPMTTSLPPVTPTPHIDPAELTSATPVLSDNFDINRYGWQSLDGYSRGDGVDVKDGALYLASLVARHYNMVRCGYCTVVDGPYYLRIDLTTDQATSDLYGVAVDWVWDDARDFYVYEINPETGSYYLYHHTADTWSLRSSGHSDRIRPFPATNTLGILVNQDTLELYINDRIVDAYHEAQAVFQNGRYGFYTDDSGFNVILDNLSIFKK